MGELQEPREEEGGAGHGSLAGQEEPIPQQLPRSSFLKAFTV